MRTQDGEDYILLKEAGAMTGCSERELRVLCLEGKVRSRWLPDGNCFVGKVSLLKYMEKGNMRAVLHGDVEDSHDLWQKRMFKRFHSLVAVAVIFVGVLIFSLFSFGNGITLKSESDAALGASTFNSMKIPASIDGGNLVVATVLGVNDILAEGIEKVLVTTYRTAETVFR
jgi:hypothetical protein